MPTQEQVSCRKCKRVFVPTPSFDFYPDGDDPKVGLCESCVMSEMFTGGQQREGPSPLPAGYKEDVCRVGKGAATCSFLMFGGLSFECAKGSEFEATIKAKLEEGSMVAKGDNCSGPPSFTPVGKTA